MNRMTSSASILSLFAVVVLAASPARPCSPATPTLHGNIAPADGATGVPLNGRVVIESFLAPSSFEGRLHGPDDDEGIPLPTRTEARHIIFELDGLVSADTDYTVVFTTFGDDLEMMGEERPPLSFTTADERDDEAPELLEEPALDVEYRAAAPLGYVDSCGGGLSESWGLTVTPPRASDDVAGFRLLRREGVGVVETYVTVNVDSGVLYDTQHEGGPHSYVVEAFDLAGNIVQSDDLEVSLVPFVGGCSAQAVTQRELPTLALSLLVLGGRALRRRRVSRS